MQNKLFDTTRNDCPHCGKKNSACQGSSQWGHNILCCSKECGFLVGEKIKKNIQTAEYQETLKQYYELEKKLKQMKYKGVAIDNYPPYESLTLNHIQSGELKPI